MNRYIPEEERWKRDANCAELPPAMFFPDDGAGVVIAKKVCANCLVTEECLEYALRNQFKDGVWGGTSERERRRIVKRRAMILKAINYRALEKGA